MEAKEVNNNSSSSEQQQTIQNKVEPNEDPLLKKEEEIKDRQKFDNYQPLQILGEGAYGEVILVRYIPDETAYIQMRNHSPNPDFQNNLNEDFVDLFTRMVHQDVNQRFTLDQIKQHPFYQ